MGRLGVLPAGSCGVGFCKRFHPWSTAGAGKPEGVWVQSYPPRVQGCSNGAGAALQLPFACSARGRADTL